MQAERRRRLERQAGNAVVADLHARHVSGARERGVDLIPVSAVVIAAHIVRRHVPDRRRADFKRIRHAHDGREGLVVDAHQLGGVLGGRARRRHDHGHALAGMPHLVDRERMVGRLHHRPAVAPGERNVARVGCVRNRLQAVRHVVAPGQHRQHARRRKGGLASIPRITACACGERRMTAWTWSEH